MLVIRLLQSPRGFGANAISISRLLVRGLRRSAVSSRPALFDTSLGATRVRVRRPAGGGNGNGYGNGNKTGKGRITQLTLALGFVGVSPAVVKAKSTEK